MTVRYPTYFEDFRCIAAQCPDSCCKEWDVEVDEASAARYEAVPGDLGEALRHAMYRDADGNTWFAAKNGRCPFWRTDSLCRIQAEQGHEALCKTCREFPRLTHDYGDFLEQGLSLSCPAAAPLILGTPATQWKTLHIPGGEAPEYDRQDMQLLLQTRDVMCRILSSPDYTVPEALAVALLYAYDAQAALDSQEPCAEYPHMGPEEIRILAAQAGAAADPAVLITFYQELEILTDRWRSLLASPQADTVWDERLRALARYGVERYWLQAISDLDLISRAKMVICSCLLVHFLGSDTQLIAQLYAKEIENDEDNVEAILDGTYTHPALTDANLLHWLLQPV